MEQKEGIAEDQDGLLGPDFELTPHEDIGAAALAIGVIEDIDPLLLNDKEAEMVRQIKKMAMLITYQALWEIYEGNKYGS